MRLEMYRKRKTSEGRKRKIEGKRKGRKKIGKQSSEEKVYGKEGRKEENLHFVPEIGLMNQNIFRTANDALNTHALECLRVTPNYVPIPLQVCQHPCCSDGPL
jgi:hypothetical protein